jgi:Raf kinase inhibitor-like YbhB/YbcL family protein
MAGKPARSVEDAMIQRMALAATLAVSACWCGCAQGEPKMTISLTSAAFKDKGPIPAKYTGDGEDVSPPLAWDKLPNGTRELALVCDDPDAPTAQPWVHWVIYKLPPDTKTLDEGVAADPRLAKPAGALQGRNSWSDGRTIGYRGPAPPPGAVHHYRFHLYALDAPVNLEPGLDKHALERAIQGHVLGEGLLMGTYKR